MAWLSNLLGRRGDPARRAVELAERLNRQRVMWLDAVHLELSEAKAIALNSPEQTVSSSEIASAFQAVLVLSLVQANKYIRTAEMAHFAKALCAGLTNGELTNSWLGATDRYTNLKKRPIGEQLLTLSEEIASSVTGSTATAMLLGPGLMLSSNEFMHRSLGVASDHFGDDATTHRIARVVSKMHEEQLVADSTSSVPESLEEKATSAPTLWRVVMEATDLRLQREYPQAVRSSNWSDFEGAATVGGCVALAIQLHAEVPEGLRTPLERAMRAALSEQFPRSDAAYEDCTKSVREAMLAVPRDKRRNAINTLIAMWVFGAIGTDDSLVKNAHLLAELAHVYQNEASGFWQSA